jgi:hypothetical protein
MRVSRTMLIFLVLLLASAGIAAQKHPVETNDDAETAAIHDYRLSLDKLERAAAAGDEILKLRATEPNLAKEIDDAFSQEPPLDEHARNIDSKFPQIAAILRAHGFTTREFLIIRFALVVDLYYVESKKEDGKPIDPENVLPANVALIEKNLERIRALALRTFAGLEN